MPKQKQCSLALEYSSFSGSISKIRTVAITKKPKTTKKSQPNKNPRPKQTNKYQNQNKKPKTNQTKNNQTPPQHPPKSVYFSRHS